MCVYPERLSVKWSKFFPSCDAFILNMWPPPPICGFYHQHEIFRVALLERRGMAHWILNHLPPEEGTLLWYTSYWSKGVTWPQLDARAAGKCSLWMSSCPLAVSYRKGARIFVTEWVAAATSSKVANDYILHWELSSGFISPRETHRWTQDSHTRSFRAALLVIAKPWNYLEYPWIVDLITKWWCM